MDAFIESDRWFPLQNFAGARNIRLALLWVTHTTRVFDIGDAAWIANDPINCFSKLKYGHLVLVTNIDRQMLIRVEQCNYAFNQIIDETKGTSLASIAVDGELLTKQCLFQQVR